MNSRVRIIQQGQEQILHIPHELALESQDVQLYREGNKLIIEPVPKRIGLDNLLKQWDTLGEDFPEIEDLALENREIF